MLDLANTVQWQARRIEELEDRVAELEQFIADKLAIPDRPDWCDVFGLQPMSGKMLHMLMTVDGMASRVWLEDTLWPGAVPAKAPEVHMSKLRQALAAAGLRNVIVTVWGYGWRIDPPDRERIKAYAEQWKQKQGRAR